MRFFVNLLGGVLAGLLLASPAGAVDFPPVGGPGDAGSAERCPPGQYLVGFSGRAGLWIDQINIVCAPLVGPLATGNRTPGTPRGGSGGGPSQQACDTDGLISGIILFETKNRQLARIEFRCTRLSTGKRPAWDWWKWRAFGGNYGGVWASSNPESNPAKQNCAPGEAAIGVNLRYGRHVNAAGLICAPIDGAALVTAGMCTDFYTRWRQGHEDPFFSAQCGQIMGIDAYCAARDSNVIVDYYGNRPDRRLICVTRYKKDSIGEQIERIVTGVAEGVMDAFIAASPYLGPIVEAASCVNGVLYACAALALEMAQRAGAPIPGIAIDASRIAQDVMTCVNGNIANCAKLGERGVKAVAGVTIPGSSIARALTDARDCTAGQFAACARLGQMAADAAGVPIVPQMRSAADALACLKDAGFTAACTALGQDVAKAADELGVPLGGLADGVALAQACARNKDFDACVKLGKAAAKAAGVPVDLAVALGDRARQCASGDADACIAIGKQALKAAGVPLDNVALVERCAKGDSNACLNLASRTTGVPLGDAGVIAGLVSRCLSSGTNPVKIGNLTVIPPDCGTLGEIAVKRYGSDDVIAMMTPAPRAPLGVVGAMAEKRKAGGLVVSRTDGFESWIKPGRPTSAAAVPAVVCPPGTALISGACTNPCRAGEELNGAGKCSSKVAEAACPRGTARIGGACLNPCRDGDELNAGGKCAPKVVAETACPAGTVRIGNACTNPCPAGQEIGKAGKCVVVLASACPSGEVMYNGACLNPCADGQRLNEKGRCIGGPVMADLPPLPAPTRSKPIPPPPPVVVAPPVIAPPPVVAAPPVVRLPRGACPAREAVARQDVNVRDGAGGAVLNPPLQRGQVVSCMACDGSWCLIASANPHSTVSQGFLDFTFANAPMTPATPAPPPAAAPANFAGDWIVGSDKGWTYYMSFSQNGGAVVGTFVDQGGLRGDLRGTVGGNTFTYTWTEEGDYSGDGVFTMAADGSLISGSYRVNDKPGLDPNLKQGTWQGTRGARPPPPPVAAVPPANFAGDWIVVSDKSWTFYMNFVQNGASIDVTFVDQANLHGKMRGTVSGSTFTYTWTEDGDYSGDGVFSMAADGSLISGSYRVNPKAGVAPDLLQGNWQGTRGVRPVATAPPDDDPIDYGGCAACGPDNAPIDVK